MGTSRSEFAEFVVEQLAAAIPQLSVGRFFGGSALRSGSVLFAMVMDNALYFAVDDRTRREYESLGSRCFSYATKKGRVDVKRFFEVPADVIEDQERLVAFATQAVAAAAHARPGKKGAHRASSRNRSRPRTSPS